MPAWSPDGKSIAYVCYEDGPFLSDPSLGYAKYTEEAAEICVIDRNGSNKLRLTHNQTADDKPTWSPDSQHIAFVASDGLYITTPNGMGSKRIVENKWIESVTWSPNGQKLAFSECEPTESAQIFVVDSSGDNLKQLTNAPAIMSETPVWSPDGLRLAYLASNGSCSDARFIGKTFRLRVLDISSETSEEMASTDLAYVYGLSWLTSKEITFYSQTVEPNSTQFELSVVNVDTHQVAAPLSKVRYGGRYAWSTDRSFIAYSDLIDRLYVTSSRVDNPTQIWMSTGSIRDIQWSPDDEFILVNSSDPISGTLNPQYSEAIWLISRDGSSATRLTNP